MGRGNRIDEVDIAKGIGILLVVIGHSIPDANTGIQNLWWGGIFKWIYSFHMALFMAMAGFLFWNKVEKEKDIVEKQNETLKRAKRLLIPYCFYSFIIFGAKMVFSAWSRKPVGMGTLVDVAFGNSPCGNVWFLWTLFMISVIVLWLPRNEHPEWLMMVFGMGYFFQDSIPWFDTFGISRILNMGVWFCVGLVMAKHYDKLARLKEQAGWKLWICVFGTFDAQVLLLKVKEYYTTILIKMMLCIVGIFLIWLISVLLIHSAKESFICSKLRFFGRESMVIYLLSYFIQTPGVTAYAKIGDFGIPYWLWVVGLAIGSITFAVIASNLVIRRNQLLSKLMIGE